MEFLPRWKKIDKLGEGGQGQVWRALDQDRVKEEIDILRETFLPKVNSEQWRHLTTRAQEYLEDTFLRAVLHLVKCRDPEYLGALKILHLPKDARDPENAKQRIRNEIDVMYKLQHPGFLKILDKDPHHEWYVSEFCPRGSLADSPTQFNGNLPKALSALRPIIEGLGKLHKDGHVHRDIKPQNVFVTDSNELKLGDFGLVYFEDADHTRLSATFDNVGTRDWMPPWAEKRRIEEVQPNFDVYSLGKVLWSMLSGRLFLQREDYDDDDFNLCVQFPRSRYMRLANQILAKCIVRKPVDCLPDAGALLEYVDDILAALESGADFIDGSTRSHDGDGRINNPKRLCRVCGLGLYKVMSPDFRQEFGLRDGPKVRLSILTCDRCGYVEFFATTTEHMLKPATFYGGGDSSEARR